MYVYMQAYSSIKTYMYVCVYISMHIRIICVYCSELKLYMLSVKKSLVMVVKILYILVDCYLGELIRHPVQKRFL